ncbi:hypothetical protein ABB37_06895 [Leptomonas pyrrhocoris]|uniref:CHASE domain-containing protein n=1 Tax=Leptomonas pyrrhocoris TaxID=157538 RepID=A0A0M9FWH5_LEPPY|nr:hypothetical protein ABB37_06895 [Leptomonas pyrrhocoris]KPA77510.1 hypothetical protein ABB37_06895 [Leptomonas pyrrhocoris]|eukprot:XP_015655949.1 hypothetical protein ABB37_06895 [Leptomonas pyrrhocoris]
MLQDAKLTPSGVARARATSTQTRIYVLIVGFVLTLLLIFAAVFTPLIVLKNEDAAYVSSVSRLEQQLASAAVVPFRQAIANASVITKALQGYVLSRATTLPRLNTSAQARMDSQRGSFNDFDAVVPTIARQVAFIAMVVLQPGGVYSMIWPAGSSLAGRDVMLPTDYAHNFSPTPQDTLRGGEVAYVGPFFSSIEVMNGIWIMAVRRPVYSRTDTKAPIDLDTFWGFTQTVVNISDVLAKNPFNFSNYINGKPQTVHYLLTTRAKNTDRRVVVASSLSDTSPEAVEEFVEHGTSVMVMPNHYFMITVLGRDYGKWFSANNITIIVATATAGLFFIFAVFVALLLYCTQTYDGTVHAPKLAPFAILTVGPCRGEELWELAPDEMADVAERLSQLLTSQMQRHHAYQIQQVHPLTTSYVTRGVAAAVQMAFDAIEELHRHPIDAALQRLLGDDGCLLVSYAVHWCNDAVVRLDPMEGGYRYEGPDVVYGGRMWAFAPPSVVTASEAVAQALPRFGLCCVTAEPYRRVNVVRSRCACGATGDCDMNGSSGDSSGSGTATIYVPLSAPTTVAATAGMCRGGGGGGAALYRLTAMARDTDNDKDTPLPPQMLLTLVDPRRPVLMAARAAAQAHASHRHRWPLSMSLPNVADAEAHSPHPVHEVVAGSGAVARREAGSQNPLCGVRIGGSFHSSEEEMMEATSSAVPGSSLPNFGSSSSEVGVSGTTAVERVSLVIQGDGVTRALLRPVIPHALDVALHVAFDYQAITLGMSYNSMRVLVYYFYSSYKILFRPLAAPERHNIYRRLVTAFGVPQQGILEHLAARCAIRCLQHSSKQRQLTMSSRCASCNVGAVLTPPGEHALRDSKEGLTE